MQKGLAQYSIQQLAVRNLSSQCVSDRNKTLCLDA